MTPDEILQHFRDTNALLSGHFLLSSGLHSSAYLQCALALQDSSDAAKFGAEIAARVVIESGTDFDTVASPAIGGLIIGFAVAHALQKRFIWTERQNGEMTLRRGFTVRPDERVLVVEDVITTGGSTRECIGALREHGAAVVAAASIVDRSNGAADVGVPRFALVEMDVTAYAPAACPMCAEGRPASKPGSRMAAN